ncbi:hypothetical protein WIS52_28350 [Pseudonocardia nematodicida]|uniref:Uncharacterized protein n=1 Tax=Pseudonocardia nematodicida TaxID=1206997 RepID=A0ABV1KIW2_9PSEU
MTAPNLPKVTPAGTPSPAERPESWSGADWFRVGRYGPRILLRGALVGGALVVLVLLLVGCAGASTPEAGSGSGAPPSSSTVDTPAPSPAGGGEQDDALPWPVADRAAADEMQQQADRGGSPWVLDPEQVALSYAEAELGYQDPSATVPEPGRAEVADGATAGRAALTLEQPVRPGPGGIWTVTAIEKR